MNQQNTYILKLKELPKGKSVFEFKLNNKFFAQYENVDISNGTVNVKISVEKRLANIELAFDLQGVIMVICDRCLEEMPLPISYQENILVKFSKEFNDSDEIIVIDDTEGEFDVSWLLYEMTVMAVPVQHSHPSGLCNKEMIEIYNKYIVSDKYEDF